MSTGSPARTIVLSYPATLSDWGRRTVEGSAFRAYLRKARGTAAPGDVWEEFVDAGCCGDALEVPLRVERVEGGDRVGADATFEFEERSDGDHNGGWRVQSRRGP